MAIGGNVDYAGAGTAAIAYSSLLDFTQSPLAWVREAMPTGRVMADAVLLPDGTVAVFNGGAASSQRARPPLSSTGGIDARRPCLGESSVCVMGRDVPLSHGAETSMGAQTPASVPARESHAWICCTGCLAWAMLAGQ